MELVEAFRMTRNRWWIPVCGLVAGLCVKPAHGQTIQVELAPPPKCCEKADTCPACTQNCPATVKDARCAKKCGIGERLRKPVSCNFKDTPFRQVVQDLREWSGINICLDETSLKEEGVDLDHPVTLKLEEVSLKSALNLLVKQM